MAFIVILLFLTYTQILLAALQWFEVIPSFNNYFRISGFFFNPAPFAIYLSALLAFCLAQALFGHSRFIQISCMITFIVGIPIITIIGSRAAWVATSIAVFFILESRFCFTTKLIKDARLVTKILAAIVIITIAFFVSNRLYELKTDSADGRLLTWNLSLKIFKDSYTLGIGRGNFPATLLKYQSLYFQNHQEQIYVQGNLVGETWFAFNDILQISIELGVLGVILLIILFVTFVKICYTTISSFIKNKNADSLIVGLMAILVVMLVSGLFSYPLMLLPFQILFCFSLGIISSNYDELLNLRDERKKNNILKSVICITAGVCYIWYGIHFYRGYSMWHFAGKDYLTSYEIEKLELDYPFLMQDSWFLLAKGKNYLENKKYSKAITTLELAKKSCPSKHLYYLLGACYESEKKFDYAERQYKFLKYSLPSLVRPRYLLAKLYYKSGQIAKWEKEALEIMNFKPKIQSSSTQAMIEDIYDLWKNNCSLKNE